MVDYKYYTDEFKGSLNEVRFNELLRDANIIVEMFVKDLVSMRYLQNRLSTFGNFDMAICYEIEMIDKHGDDSLHGTPTENDVVSITTTGYKIETDKSKSKFFEYKGLPFSSISKEMIMNELRKNGFLNRIIN